MEKIKVLTIIGTRPEALRMAPLIKGFREYEAIESIVCVAAQTNNLLEQIVDAFDIMPDFELDIWKEKHTLAGFTGKAIEGFDGVIRKVQPDLVLVHGGTTAMLAGSLAAVYNKARLAHVEEDLRFADKYSPFPEEMDRKLIATLSDIHFVSTYAKRKSLIAEGIREQGIYVVGDTAIDAINEMTDENHVFEYEELNKIDFMGRKVVMVTAHRRENWGEPLENICKALKRIALSNQEVEIVFQVPMNPVAKATAYGILSENINVHLVPPLDFKGTCNLMSRCCLMISDSGGFKEEASYMGKTILVLRRAVEKTELAATGMVKIVGTDEEGIFEEGSRLLHGKEIYSRQAAAGISNGDGNASKRIIDAILFEFGLLEKAPEHYRSRRV